MLSELESTAFLLVKDLNMGMLLHKLTLKIQLWIDVIFKLILNQMAPCNVNMLILQSYAISAPGFGLVFLPPSTI